MLCIANYEDFCGLNSELFSICHSQTFGRMGLLACAVNGGIKNSKAAKILFQAQALIA